MSVESSQDITKVSGGYRVGDWRGEVGVMEGVVVVGYLGEDSGKVYGVYGCEVVFLSRRKLKYYFLFFYRKSSFPKTPLTTLWHSSNVPSLTCTLTTFSSSTLHICAYWTGEMRFCGWRMNTFMLALFRRP